MPDPAVPTRTGRVGLAARPTRRGASARRAPAWYRQAALWYPVIAAVIFLAAWWLYAKAVDPLLFSSPQRSFAALRDMVATGELPTALGITLRTFVVGAGVGTLAGMVLGLVASLVKPVRAVVTPLFVALWATPIIAMVPLIIIWFGIDDFGRLALVFIATVVPVYMNAEVGFAEARPDLIEVARSFSASRRDTVWHVTLPGAVPYLVAGLRIGLGRALGAVIVAEMFLDLTGMGGLIQTSGVYLRLDRMLAGAFVVACVGTLLIIAIDLLERRIAPWRGGKES